MTTPARAAEPGWVASFDRMWSQLAFIGRDADTGGYRRYAWTDADLTCREWFVATARERDLDVETDRNGNLWAWWGDPARGDAVAVGSHLDSVPDGGAFDGPLGVVSAFSAIDRLRERGIAPRRPLAVVAFSDEEGARFGVACVGSRLLTGQLDPARARALRDAEGETLESVMRRAGHDPARLGPEPDRLARIGRFIELHIEQGRGLIDIGAPVGVASEIWPHGRWRLEFTGEANHAGTTRLTDRHDPMLAFASAVLVARSAAQRHDGLATFGKVHVRPGGVNAIPQKVTAWLDARAAGEPAVRAIVADVARSAEDTDCLVAEESWTAATPFDATLRDRIRDLLGGAPVLATGAGHDAGVLANAGVATAMLFVRNPTGVSHSPLERADRADCLAGVDALATVLADAVR